MVDGGEASSSSYVRAENNYRHKSARLIGRMDLVALKAARSKLFHSFRLGRIHSRQGRKEFGQHSRSSTTIQLVSEIPFESQSARAYSWKRRSTFQHIAVTHLTCRFNRHITTNYRRISRTSRKRPSKTFRHQYSRFSPENQLLLFRRRNHHLNIPFKTSHQQVTPAGSMLGII